MLNNANNPQALLMQLAQQNPTIKQAIEISKQYGGDYNKAAEDLAQKNGIDINEILNLI